MMISLVCLPYDWPPGGPTLHGFLEFLGLDFVAAGENEGVENSCPISWRAALPHGGGRPACYQNDGTALGWVLEWRKSGRGKEEAGKG
jgi:hypothetical protein